jgi:hypothetical protein
MGRSVLGDGAFGSFYSAPDRSFGRQDVEVMNCPKAVYMICFVGVELESRPTKKGIGSIWEHLGASGSFSRAKNFDSPPRPNDVECNGGTIGRPCAHAILSSPPCSISCLAAVSP